MQAKEIAQRGEWLAFLEAVDIDPRQAQRLMHYARALDEVGPPENGKLPPMNAVDEYVHDQLTQKLKTLDSSIENFVRAHPEKIQLHKALQELRVCRISLKQAEVSSNECHDKCANQSRILNAQKTRLRELDAEAENMEERVAIMQE